MVMVNNFYGILSECFYGILILLTSLLVNPDLANWDFIWDNKSTAQHMPIDLVLTPFCVFYCFAITWWVVVVTVLFHWLKSLKYRERSGHTVSAGNLGNLALVLFHCIFLRMGAVFFCHFEAVFLWFVKQDHHSLSNEWNFIILRPEILPLICIPGSKIGVNTNLVGVCLVHHHGSWNFFSPARIFIVKYFKKCYRCQLLYK